jgi:hypothetical protein
LLIFYINAKNISLKEKLKTKIILCRQKNATHRPRICPKKKRIVFDQRFAWQVNLALSVVGWRCHSIEIE